MFVIGEVLSSTYYCNLLLLNVQMIRKYLHDLQLTEIVLEFIEKSMGIDKRNLPVTCFKQSTI